MKDKLEKFIDQNRDSFDQFEPSPDLWDNIQANLETPEIKSVKKRNNFTFYALRAAAVLVFGLFSVFIYEQFFDQDQLVVSPSQEKYTDDTVEIDPEIKELIEAEAFYNKEVENLIAELDEYTPEYDFVKEGIMYDLAELDSAYVELKEELSSKIYNEEVVESMIENYRLKIMLLEEVLDQLRRTKDYDESEETYDVSI